MSTASNGGTKPAGFLKPYALAGVIGPIFATIVVSILASLRTDYSSIANAISDLGYVGAPNALVQDANFIITGLPYIAFAYGLQKGIAGGGSKLGPMLVVVNGVFGGLLVGLYPEPGDFHKPFAVVGYIALIAAPLVISSRLKQDARWQPFGSIRLGRGSLQRCSSLSCCHSWFTGEAHITVCSRDCSRFLG